MNEDYNNLCLIEIVARTIIDCHLIASRQEEKKCGRNKYTCNKTNCIYYLREIDSCVGVIEYTRCDDCLIDKVELKNWCIKRQRRLNAKKENR